ncbi:DUF1285 domain-containing protein [Neomegalonema sp.]|uniref:DUF1285 domain-containing protein n=1 Tax=Neomegalonema sp. TaxID=2039713 RepID=UPI002623EA5E|nr:DUF1285 domain-containing protein [Neomegalonema sp.]MDD2868697.1 DUF1285 domain-containing protein [Neomegalonema sp.]
MSEPPHPPSSASPSLAGLGEAKKTRLPRHLWNPSFCGEIDIVIRRDGTWIHEGRPILRRELTKLFASVLRREGDEHHLVTPVEKMRIRVEDAPFLAVDMREEGEGRARRLIFATNLDEEAALDSPGGLRAAHGASGGLTPYLRMRDGLEARLDRKTTYRLIELGEAEGEGEEAAFGIWSGGIFHPLAPASEAEP